MDHSGRHCILSDLFFDHGAYVDLYPRTAAVSVLGGVFGCRAVFSYGQSRRGTAMAAFFPECAAFDSMAFDASEKKCGFFAKTCKKTLSIFGKMGYNKNNTIFSEAT